MSSVLAAVSASSSAILRAAAAAASSFSARTPSSSATRASLCAARASVSARSASRSRSSFFSRAASRSRSESCSSTSRDSSPSPPDARARSVRFSSCRSSARLRSCSRAKVASLSRASSAAALLERRLPRLHAGLVLLEPALRRGRAPPGLLLRLVRRHVLLLEALHRRQHEHAADLPLPALPVAVAVDQRLHVRNLLVDLRLRLRVGLLRVREERPERVRRDVRGPVGPPPRGERGVVLALDDLPERELGLRLVQLVLRGLATALGVAQRPRRPLELLPARFTSPRPRPHTRGAGGVRGGRRVRAVGPGSLWGRRPPRAAARPGT